MTVKHSENKAGFTLLELLVVIAIIGMLSSAIMVAMTNAREKARDAKRKSDLQSLNTALNLYYDNNGQYPGSSDTTTGDWTSAFKTQLLPYTSSPPKDPLQNNASRYYAFYRISSAPDASCNNSYTLLMYLESSFDADYGKQTCGYGTNHYFRLLGQ